MITRRRFLAAVAAPPALRPAPSKKRVVVAGAGMSGLRCALELGRRGHDVVVVEASGRIGGHVMTVRDGLADGLYADAGAEHFYKPGYDLLWAYLEEFKLPLISYPRRQGLLRSFRGQLYTPEMLAERSVLRELGFNQQEVAFLSRNPFGDLPALYYSAYVDRFSDIDRPFDAGLNRLDAITATEFLRRQGASQMAAQMAGGSRSALQAVWHSAIRRKRGMAWLETNLYRVAGGNQRITEAFAQRLGDRVRLHCPVTSIKRFDRGVRITCRQSGAPAPGIFEADRLVNAMPLATLRQIPVEPEWPPAKNYVIRNMPYDSHARVVFQSRTRFWERDHLSPNMNLGEPGLSTVWSMAEEVKTARGILIGTAGTTSEEVATATYRRRYPGKFADIEQARVIHWNRDPWSMACLPLPLRPGELSKYWPEVVRPCGPVHFAGVSADAYPFGLESAIRAARRVAEEIDAA